MSEAPISTRFDDRRRPDETVSEAVISAVADVTGQSPLEMTPLAKTIDSDALNALFQTGNGNDSGIAVTFEYSDCYVTIDSETVQVESIENGQQSQVRRKVGH